jgi:multimeric flavodoxin WrbA
MQDVNVVVVFYSRFGSTERLALAAAVGAVQARANIRLRRLPDTTPDSGNEETTARIEEWRENRARMNREYVAPRESDVAWADAIIVGMPDEREVFSTEFQRYFDSVGKIERKIGASFMQGCWTASFYDAIGRAGFTAVPVIAEADLVETARMQGRRVAEAARVLRAART